MNRNITAASQYLNYFTFTPGMGWNLTEVIITTNNDHQQPDASMFVDCSLCMVLMSHSCHDLVKCDKWLSPVSPAF